MSPTARVGLSVAGAQALEPPFATSQEALLEAEEQGSQSVLLYRVWASPVVA